ncbi:MAG: tetratricopeptide repeat protein [Chloroflexota bacterium]|jgi:tetratricopeptide (TPR) repeat protein
MDKIDFEVNFSQGTRLLHRGKAGDAIFLLERAVSVRPDHTDAAINLSGAYILTGKFKKALALLEPLSEREPDNAMVWTNLGAAYLGNPVLARDEEQKKAIAAFERALEIRPAAPSVAYNIGLIYRDREDTEEAARWFRQAVRDNPKDHHARSMLDEMSP